MRCLLVLAVALLSLPTPARAQTAAPPAADREAPLSDEDVQRLLVADCDVKVDGPSPRHYVVSPLGRVYHAPEEVTETQSVTVVVVAHKGVAQRLLLQRASDVRNVNEAHWYGSLDTFVGPGRNLGDVVRPSTDCLPLATVVSHLAPETAEFTVAYFNPSELSSHPLATLSFSVYRTYVGTITFGPIVSSLPDRSFTLVPQDAAAEGSPSVIAEDVSLRARLVVGIAPFLKPRAVRPGSALLSGAGPFFGLDLENPLSHFYLGANVSFYDAFGLSVGLHAGRVTRLPAGFTLAPDATFAGDAVPTTERLAVGVFAGANVDLRSAALAFGDAIKQVVR